MEVWLVLQRSEHPDDRRLTGPTELPIDVQAVPREGEYLELPWPLQGRSRTTERVRAHVDDVEHFWIEGDLHDNDGPIPVLRVRLTATLLDPDITDGPWE